MADPPKRLCRGGGRILLEPRGSYPRLRSICMARRRDFLPPPPASPAIPPRDCNIFCICTNCLSRRFTSSTVVPLPFAIRLRRLPLLMCCLHRSSGAVELLIASLREVCF